jgi:hypothetical protein
MFPSTAVCFHPRHFYSKEKIHNSNTVYCITFGIVRKTSSKKHTHVGGRLQLVLCPSNQSWFRHLKQQYAAKQKQAFAKPSTGSSQPVREQRFFGKPKKSHMFQLFCVPDSRQIFLKTVVHSMPFSLFVPLTFCTLIFNFWKENWHCEKFENQFHSMSKLVHSMRQWKLADTI